MRATCLFSMLALLGIFGAGAAAAEDRKSSEPEVRRSLYMTGASVGYLFPASGSYAYERSSGAPLLGSGTVTESPSQILRITMQNIWQFDEFLLMTDGFAGILPDRFLLGVDLDLNYLFGKGMVSPFAGGGAGIHYGPVDDDGGALSTRPAVNAQAGLLLFRGFDVNVVARGQYAWSLAGDRDHGFLADVGVVYAFESRSRPRD